MNMQVVTELLYEVIDEINAMRPISDHLPKDLATVLSGDGGALDSLGLVNFIVATEQRIEARFHVSLMLIDEGEMYAATSPIETVSAMANHITNLLKGAHDE